MAWSCCQGESTTVDWKFERNEVDPAIYRNEDIDDIFEGVSYIFTGTLKANNKLLMKLIAQNTADGKQDIALLLRPSISNDCLIANSQKGLEWAEEKRQPSLQSSLKLGSQFCIQVLVTEECYMIAVNGAHLMEYKHTMDFKLVNCIVVEGKAERFLVIRSLVGSYPNRVNEAQAKNVPRISGPDSEISENSKNGSPKALPNPYMGILPSQGISNGSCLKIAGRLLSSARSFSISLQQEQNIWPQSLVAFRFKALFELDEVSCSTAFYYKEWSEEEPVNSEWLNDLAPGGAFTLDIVASDMTYEVNLNDENVVRFNQRLEPECGNILFIQGDVALEKVVLVENCNLESGTAQEAMVETDNSSSNKGTLEKAPPKTALRTKFNVVGSSSSSLDTSRESEKCKCKKKKDKDDSEKSINGA